MRELVSATFATQWPIVAPGVPFALEDEPATIPDEFALLSVVPTTGQQMTMGRAGTRRVRRNVWIQVKLWATAGQGVARISALGDAAQRIFELQSFAGPGLGDPLTVQAATGIKRSGSADSTDGRWTMLLVRMPAWYSEIL